MADVSIVTDVGLGLVTSRLKGLGNEPLFCGWGTGTTTPVAGNTSLEAPASEARVSGTTTQQTTNTTNDTYKNVATITAAGASKAISEVALFDSASAGNCFMRATFSVINVSVGDSIQFSISTIFDQA